MLNSGIICRLIVSCISYGDMHQVRVSCVGYWCYISVTSVVSVTDVVSDTGVRCQIHVLFFCVVSVTGVMCCS